MIFDSPHTAEEKRLLAAHDHTQNWQRWGTYLPERQWGTVREDYSDDGNSWAAFTYEEAADRAYRWGEDGLLGWTDRECRLTLATALWNGRDPLLKERLFGLTNGEGNHGEDVKELFYYLDATPTHSYAKALYKYPQIAFPYLDLRTENKRRTIHDREYELLDTGAFDDNRYFDVEVEYAKPDADTVYLRLTVTNRAQEPAHLSVLPTLTLRNTWAGPSLENMGDVKPSMHRNATAGVTVEHPTLGSFECVTVGKKSSDATPQALLMTENESRARGGKRDPSAAHKGAFHDFVVQGRRNGCETREAGTRAAFLFQLEMKAGETRVVRVCLRPTAKKAAPDTPAFDRCFKQQMDETDAFYAKCIATAPDSEEFRIQRQALAGLLWSKQFYFFAADQWFPPEVRDRTSTPKRLERTEGWTNLFCRDVLSMPDKWEYPWFASWDMAFHCLSMSIVDPEFAKGQLLLLLREWYLHPNGQMPAYEFGFSDVNPPVHAWAVMRVYEAGCKGKKHGDLDFLERAFHKLLLNFTWWTNRVDGQGNKLFAGGFLGLDNISLFNRSMKLPEGISLNQADGNAWFGLFASSMLEIALELAAHRTAYADVASTFAEDYVRLAAALNTMGGEGLWDEEDGFYFDQLTSKDGSTMPLKVRTMVGLAPLFAVLLVSGSKNTHLDGLTERMRWFLQSMPSVHGQIQHVPSKDKEMQHSYFASLVPEERLRRIMTRLLDETEFLAPCGVRAMSRAYKDQPFQTDIAGHHLEAAYAPEEGTDAVFGGNSNWRGPVWFPVNYLLVFALERYGHIFGNTVRMECPTGSGKMLTYSEVAAELRFRLLRPFLPDPDGHRPVHDHDPRYTKPEWKDLLLFYEYFSGETGRGVGASHQTGWTALIANVIAAPSVAQHARADGSRHASGAAQ